MVPLEKSVDVLENVNLYNVKVKNISSAMCLRQGLLIIVFAISDVLSNARTLRLLFSAMSLR